MTDAAEIGRWQTHTSHWGPFLVSPDASGVAIRPHPLDPEPSALLDNIPDAPRHAARVAAPMVRKGWLEHGPGPSSGRGREPFVAVGWEEVLDLVAGDLRRVYDAHGPGAVYGGSYGWASAGRLHHAQSQLHRFLNCLGGHTASVHTYSSGAASVILPRVFAPMQRLRVAVPWSSVVGNADLVVAFGGMAIKNAAVGGGGPGQHVVRRNLEAARARGARFVLISPIRDDLPLELEADWLPIRPSTDTALMLALAHTLLVEGLHDQSFLDRHSEGFPTFRRYLLGEDDGCPKSPEWAASITDVPPETIRALARRMAGSRTLVTVSHSLQRAQYGEQPVWMGLVLAAMLGQIGCDGTGYTYSLGAFATVGKDPPLVHTPALPPGRNPSGSYIPVSRVADMLLHPRAPYDFDGQKRRYPDIRLVYWAGGNPFHHHQDLNRLRDAFARPETIVVHEPFWTATARQADIVLPSTITLEREDIGGSSDDAFVFAMHRVVEPYAQARDDYAIFGALAERLGRGGALTEGRTAREWIEHLYAGLADRLETVGVHAPSFPEFWAAGELTVPTDPDPAAWLRQFRLTPEAAPLATPSGKIEIYSATIAAFGYEDCLGHPVWIEPDEWLGSPRAAQFPLQLVANQPAGRLHSQLDFGAESQRSKVGGREVLRMNPLDAAARGIEDGATVKVFNDRGACLAVARLSDDLRAGVVQLPTGAWYAPADLPGEPSEVCTNGNPNVLTRDVGTSRLAQACTGQLCLVDVSPIADDAPPAGGHAPPEIVWTREQPLPAAAGG